MKTTLDLDDELLAQAKALAARQRTTLTQVIEQGLRLRLHAPAAPVAQGKARIRPLRGRGGLSAGIDPLSNRSLYDAADDDA